MQTNEFKKAAVATLPVRNTKVALRHLARNNTRSNLIYSLVNLKTAMGKFMTVVQPYLLGMAADAAMKKDALDCIGEVGKYMVTSCKLLGVKLPSATKKCRLKTMTRGKAILTMDGYATDALAKVNRLFDESLELPLPDVLKLSPEEQLDVLTNARKANSAIIAKREQHLHDEIGEILQKMVPLYWALVYDMFSVTPAQVFDVLMENIGGVPEIQH